MLILVLVCRIANRGLSQGYLAWRESSLEAAGSSSNSWRQSQHFGEKSFDTHIEDGVLTITKTGDQSWFSYRQSLDAAEFAGQQMIFSAEVKLDLQPPAIAHVFGEGGWLRVTARSNHRRILMSSPLEHVPHIGKTDWEKIQVSVVLPADTHRVDLSILHQADGVMSVRNPFFGRADADACGAKVHAH